MAEEHFVADALTQYLEIFSPKARTNGKAEKELDIGFEQISKTELHIADIQDRLLRKKLKGSKKLRAESELEELEAKLAKLRAAHEQGAIVLRQKAAALEALPSEMRDAIFRSIYVQSEPIAVSWKRCGSEVVFNMPKDTALYMSRLHVGETLARQAAEVFYKYNTFSFSSENQNNGRLYGPDYGLWQWDPHYLTVWATRDHYGSDCNPWTFVRTLAIRLPELRGMYNGAVTWSVDHMNTGRSRVCSHREFEEICTPMPSNHDLRERLRIFRHWPSLRSIHLSVHRANEWDFDTYLRIVNPIVREYKAAGINITFIQAAGINFSASQAADHELPAQDLTMLFDNPSEEDPDAYLRETGRRITFRHTPGRNIFDSWKLAHESQHNDSNKYQDVFTYACDTVSEGFIRTWLHEHYEMYKFLEREAKEYDAVQKIVAEYRNLDSEDQALRRAVLPSIMTYFQ